MSTDTTTNDTYDNEYDDGTEWTGWVNVLLGLWVLVTPFFLGQLNATGFWNFSGGWLYWSNIVTGILIVAFAAYTAYAN